MPELNPTIPTGSLVLVTGVTGYVASQVAKQFLERGYKVRGTVRDPKRASWLVDDVFKSYAASGDFEFATVPDLATPSAFDQAVKGVAAICHVASIVNFDPEPNNVIPQTVAGAVSIMEAALTEPSVKEFVYTSSIVAATIPAPGNVTRVDRSTWNDQAVQLAWSAAADDPKHGSVVYQASKVEAEKAIWRFVEEKKPHFSVNSVCPSSIMGEPLDRSHIGSPAAWIKQLYDRNVAFLSRAPALFAVDVKDVARLHLAAVLDRGVRNERLQAWSHPCNWNDILAILRQLYPQHEFVEDLRGMTQLEITTDQTLSEALLRRWGSQDGWTPLKQTVQENMDPILGWESTV
ncbi:hypothetical protein N7478_010304 [Penicillium angulare]|uniref:uncharacterized protein n=1 Tax=Penicillium angulare TaxID=116970 RepID=UPI0025425611|nr:uncharacterized protein N7478_010304 [Penicillium angulare]KAJ5267496.1 hypothetical protein N7478_010304 [Penicillium angulare]